MRAAVVRQESGSRYGEMMARYLGPVILRAFAEDDVTEIYVNPQDGAVRFDTRSRGRIESGVSVPPTRVEMFLNAVATSLGLTLGSDHPGIEAELPAVGFRGSRLQGFVPPVTPALRTSPTMTLAQLVKSALRTSPTRIVVGEVRGSEALDLLDAWATGHPGGVATVHASSPEGALLRLDRLAQRANVPPQRHLVAEAIHWIAVLEGSHARRRLTDLVRVDGLDRDGHFLLHRPTATEATSSGDSQ